MGAFEHMRAEMNKVKAASLGEVIMFAGPDMINITTFPDDDIEFVAGLCVYKGISDEYAFAVKGGLAIKTTLLPNHNMEVAVVRLEDLYCPMVHQSIIDNGMRLGPKTNAYIGPKDIADFLRKEANGVLDKFFEDYVKQYRAVKG